MVGRRGHKFENAFFIKNPIAIFEVFRPGKTKGTEGILKLTKLGVATLIFGDIYDPVLFL